MTTNNPDPFDTNRDRGILSTRERDYLLGESDGIDPGSAAERAIRQSIRNHLTHTILDFPLIHQEMQKRDLNTVFDPPSEPGQKRRPTSSVQSSAADMVAFLYRVYRSEYQLELLIKNGIECEAERRGDPVHARVSIDLFPDELAETEQRFDEHGIDAVSYRDLRELWGDDRLTDDEFIEAAEQWADRWQTDYENVYEYPTGTFYGSPIESAKRHVKRRDKRTRAERLDEQRKDDDE
jgi:hypothetical protein